MYPKEANRDAESAVCSRPLSNPPGAHVMVYRCLPLFSGLSTAADVLTELTTGIPEVCFSKERYKTANDRIEKPSRLTTTNVGEYVRVTHLYSYELYAFISSSPHGTRRLVRLVFSSCVSSAFCPRLNVEMMGSFCVCPYSHERVCRV